MFWWSVLTLFQSMPKKYMIYRILIGVLEESCGWKGVSMGLFGDKDAIVGVALGAGGAFGKSKKLIMQLFLGGNRCKYRFQKEVDNGRLAENGCSCCKIENEKGK